MAEKRRYFLVHEKGTGREDGFFLSEREARHNLRMWDRIRPQYRHELRWIDAHRLPRKIAPEGIG